MFCINYEIIEEEKKRLSNIKEFEIESELEPVEAQIHLIFNNEEIGFIDKEIPYDGELIIMWLEELNEVIIQLKTNKFATMWIPDSADIWLEFKMIDEIILVNQIRVKKEVHVEKIVDNMPKKQEELFWSESISREEFFRGIFVTTSRFIQDISLLNELLLKSKRIIKLENTLKKAKQIWQYTNL